MHYVSLTIAQKKFVSEEVTAPMGRGPNMSLKVLIDCVRSAFELQEAPKADSISRILNNSSQSSFSCRSAIKKCRATHGYNHELERELFA